MIEINLKSYQVRKITIYLGQSKTESSFVITEFIEGLLGANIWEKIVKQILKGDQWDELLIR